MKSLPTRVVPARADRYATHLLYDSDQVRVVAFHLSAGQAVPPHQSDASVVVQVFEGEGIFRGEDGEVRLGPGDAAVYAPGETHSVEALGQELQFLAILAPGTPRKGGGE